MITIKSLTSILSCFALGAAALPLASGQILVGTGVDIGDAYTLGGGSVTNTAPGQFSYTYGGDDPHGGVAVSFLNPVSLPNIGDSLELRFTVHAGGGVNNNGGTFRFGLFDGGVVSENDQTSVTDAWTGYFAALGTHNTSTGNRQAGVFEQGAGSTSLLHREINRFNNLGSELDSFVAPADITTLATANSFRSRNFATDVDVSLRIERTGTEQLTITSTHSTVIDGNPATVSLFGTASIVASNEAQFSGFAIGNTSGGFGVTVIPEPGTYAALAGLLMLGLALLRRCRA